MLSLSRCYLVNEGAVVDELCPMRQTISQQELRTKGKILDKLLKKIDNERTEQRETRWRRFLGNISVDKERSEDDEE